MNLEILDQLITEGENLTPTISYVPIPAGRIRTFSVYKTTEADLYQNWQSSAQRLIKTYHPSDLEEIKRAAKQLSPDNHRKILGTLKAIKLLPTEPEKDVSEKDRWTNNINIANHQNNTQQVTISFLIDAIRNEISGRDFNAIQEIMQNYRAEPETTKNKLIEKIKGFGGDVLSNIVANILTNPSVYTGLF